MNRSTLLSCIDHHLQASLVETGEVRPLSEIVPRVAFELRNEGPSTGPIANLSAADVAAFIDGNLSDDATEAICQAVPTNHSLLAELIASVRATQELEGGMEGLSGPLSSRLAQMVETEFPSVPANVTSVDKLVPATLVRAVPIEEGLHNSERHVASRSPKKDRPALPLNRGDADSRVRAADRGAQLSRNRIVAFVVAASLLIALVFTIRTIVNAPKKGNMAQREPVRAEDELDAAMNVPPSLAENDPSQTQEQGLLPIEDESEPLAEFSTPASANASEEAVSNSPQLTQNAAIASSNTSTSLVPPSQVRTSATDSTNTSDTRPTPLVGFRWTKIRGLLAQRETGTETASGDANSDESLSDSYGGETWKSISEASNELDDLAGIEETISLKTLPSSKAEAEFESGGRMVLAADTGVNLLKNTANASASLEIEYGGLALINIPSGTSIRLFGLGKFLTQLNWKNDASAILEYSVDGLQVHVRGGSIEVNEIVFTNESIAIGDDTGVKEIDKLTRLPRWVNGSVATIPNHVLAQLDTTESLNRAIQRRINAFVPDSANPRERATLILLAQLRAALAGDNLMRLTANPNALIRFAAANRFLDLPSWDPRFDRAWRKAGPNFVDQQRANLLKRYVMLQQRGGRLGAAEIDNLLQGLDSPDATLRVIHDVMLRRALNGGPAFDFNPNWTQQNRARAISAWLKFAGRSASVRDAASQQRPGANQP